MMIDKALLRAKTNKGPEIKHTYKLVEARECSGSIILSFCDAVIRAK